MLKHSGDRQLYQRELMGADPSGVMEGVNILLRGVSIISHRSETNTKSVYTLILPHLTGYRLIQLNYKLDVIPLRTLLHTSNDTDYLL